MSEQTNDSKRQQYIGTNLDDNDHRILIELQSKFQLTEQRRISASEVMRMALRATAKAAGIVI